MSNFLDKLAMKLVEWPDPSNSIEMAIGPVGRNTDVRIMSTPHEIIEIVINDELHITESVWIKRRKELINEPCDSDAPEWAEWVAQDDDGGWYWFERKPKSIRRAFIDGGMVCGASQGKTPAGHDWRDTLRRVERGTGISEHAHSFGVDFDATEGLKEITEIDLGVHFIGGAPHKVIATRGGGDPYITSTPCGVEEFIELTEGSDKATPLDRNTQLLSDIEKLAAIINSTGYDGASSRRLLYALDLLIDKLVNRHEEP